MRWWLTKGQKYNKKVFRAHTSSILHSVLVSTGSLMPSPSTPGLLALATWAQVPITTHHQPCMQMYPLHLKSRLTMPRHLKGSLPCDLHIHQYLMILWKVYFMIHLVLFIGLACNTHSWESHTNCFASSEKQVFTYQNCKTCIWDLHKTWSLQVFNELVV